MNYLDRLFDDIEQCYGDGIDCNTMGHLSASLSSRPSDLVQQDETARDRFQRAATSMAMI